MKHQLNKIKQFFKPHLDWLLIMLTINISIGGILYFFLNNNQNLGNYDAVARLNIARKVIDSLTPGLGQLGGVWPPFPQILMVPFVQVDYLWHTGLAGALISGTAFVIAALFLYKTTLLLTKNIKASLLVWFMFVTNINILFLQTMALSEMFFIACFVMILYYLTKWINGHSMNHLLLAGVFGMLISLTRYEGYFVLLGSTLVVFLENYRVYIKESWQKVEGMTLLYLTVAGFGVILWCVYCFLFFGDFLHWLHLYSAGKLQVSSATQDVKEQTQAVFRVVENSFATSFTIYSEMIMLMVGKITTWIGIAGLAITLFIMNKKFRKKQPLQQYLPLVIISLVVFGLLVFGYQKGFIPTVHLPPKPIPVDAQKSFTIYSDSNIRYGIIIIPCILLFVGIAASIRNFAFYLILFLFSFQLLYTVYRPQVLQYSLPILWPYSTVTGVEWLREHYDYGTVLISANAHEDVMFQSKLPYKTFISEGSREYWVESLSDPSKYATWVIYDDAIQGDALYYFLTDDAKKILNEKFDLVHDDNGFKVFRLK